MLGSEKDKVLLRTLRILHVIASYFCKAKIAWQSNRWVFHKETTQLDCHNLFAEQKGFAKTIPLLPPRQARGRNDNYYLLQSLRSFAMTSTLRSSFITLFLAANISCSSAKKEEKTLIEYYPVAYRQLAPEPVYSRITWSHLPGPIAAKVRDNAPLLMPEVSFEMHRTNLDEAIQALAQTIGYTWSYPAEVGKKKISINMVAPVDEILREMESQANVKAVLDHDNRTLRIVSGNAARQLPRAQLSK